MLVDDLRKAVLQAAIQGKLVEQDPNDEPASALLDKIKEEKEQLIKIKKIKKEKPLASISEDEIPIDIPDGWEWVKLGTLFTFINGDRSSNYPKENEITDNGIPFFGAKDLNFNLMNFNLGLRFITPEKFEKLRSGKLENNDIVVLLRGAGVGRAGVFHENSIHKTGFINAQMVILRPFYFDYVEYIITYINSNLYKQQIIEKGSGTAITQLPADTLKNFMLPLPPITEQQRIVTKVEELMAKIDEFEKIEKELESIKKAFPSDMKKSLLQAAIQGKLTEQLDSDSSVDELLERIKEEKEQLSKDKKLNKKKALEPTSEEEVPFDIPINWKWVYMSDVGETNIGLTYKPSDVVTDNSGTIVLRSSNIQNNKMDYNDIVRVNFSIASNKMCHVGDILICARNGSKRLVGKSAIIDKEEMSFGAFMAIFRSKYNPYINLVINSPYFRNTLLGNAGTTTINQITQNMIKTFKIPFPPLEEQQRIVEKLDKLLPLCDEL